MTEIVYTHVVNMDVAALKTKTMGTTKFGWCLDGYHDDCWVTNGEQVCSCPCHGEAK